MIKCGDGFRFRPTYSELSRRSPRLSFFSSVCQTVARPVWQRIAQPSNLKSSHKGWCASRTAPPNTQLPPAQQFANIKKGFFNAYIKRRCLYIFVYGNNRCGGECSVRSESVLFATHRAKCYSVVSLSSELVDI